MAHVSSLRDVVCPEFYSHLPSVCFAFLRVFVQPYVSVSHVRCGTSFLSSNRVSCRVDHKASRRAGAFIGKQAEEGVRRCNQRQLYSHDHLLAS